MLLLVKQSNPRAKHLIMCTSLYVGRFHVVTQSTDAAASYQLVTHEANIFQQRKLDKNYVQLKIENLWWEHHLTFSFRLAFFFPSM